MARKSVEKNISYDEVKDLFYVNLDYGKDASGKRVKKTKTAKKISDARKILKEHEADKTRGEMTIPNEMTVSDWCDYYLDVIAIDAKLEATTLYGYTNIIKNHIKPRIGNMKLQSLSAKSIQDYIHNRMEHGLSVNTVNKHYALLKTMLSIAVKQDILKKNVAENVIVPSKEDPEIECLNAEQLSQLLEYCVGDRLEPVFYIAVYLGLRREEILALTWNDVDFENKTIRINKAETSISHITVQKKTKNKSSERTCYMVKDLEECLIRVKMLQAGYKYDFGSEYVDNDKIVCWPDGRSYRPNYISELVTKFIRDNGFPYVTLHGLRHSFVTVGVNDAGLTMYQVGKSAGHSNTTTTEKKYSQFMQPTNQHVFESVAASILRKRGD